MEVVIKAIFGDMKEAPRLNFMRAMELEEKKAKR